MGNSFSEDGLPEETFDYLISNPPFGVEWKKVQEDIVKEHENQGYCADALGPVCGNP